MNGFGESIQNKYSDFSSYLDGIRKNCLHSTGFKRVFLHSHDLQNDIRQVGANSLGYTVLNFAKVGLEVVGCYADAPNITGNMVNKVVDYAIPLFDHLGARIPKTGFHVFRDISDVLGFASSIGYIFNGEFAKNLAESRFSAIAANLICIPCYAVCVGEFGKEIGLCSLSSLEKLTNGFGHFRIFKHIGLVVPFLEKHIPAMAPAIKYVSEIRFLNNKRGLDNLITFALISVFVLLAKDAYTRHAQLEHDLQHPEGWDLVETEGEQKIEEENSIRAKLEKQEKQTKLDKQAYRSEILMRSIPSFGMNHPIVKGVLGIYAIICTARSYYHKTLPN